MLKVTPEPLIARAEAAALRAWAATSHAVALLDADPGGGALLLERVRPGTKLWDAGARPPAREMAELLIGLRAATGDLAHQLPPLSERIEFIFGLIRSRLTGARVAPLVDPGLVTAGHELARTLAQTGPTALVHGDLHLANILIARQPGQPGQPGRLVAIDPRPCLGDPDFDAVDWVLAPAAAGTPEQQIDELCGVVPGLDADRLWAWCQATAVIIVVQHLHNRPADARIPFLAPAGGPRMTVTDWDPFATIRNALIDPGLPRAMRLGSLVSDPERAQQQRLAQDRLVAADAVRTARQCGIEVIEVDGGQDAAAVADTVAGHFLPYLPISA